jgi:hypothetical protein
MVVFGLRLQFACKVFADRAFACRFSPCHDGKQRDPKFLFIKVKYGAHTADWDGERQVRSLINHDESASVIPTFVGKILCIELYRVGHGERCSCADRNGAPLARSSTGPGLGNVAFRASRSIISQVKPLTGGA